MKPRKLIRITLLFFVLLLIACHPSSEGSVKNKSKIGDKSIDSNTTETNNSICDNAQTRQDYEDCLQGELKKTEKEMDKEHERIVGNLKNWTQPLGNENIKKLSEAQQAWITYRDANCEADKTTYGTGVDGYGASLLCKKRLTVERIKELRWIYDAK